MITVGALAMAGKYRRPSHRQMLQLTVQHSERISPHFVSVTVGGEDVQHLERSGYDQNGRLFFRGPEQDGTDLPTTDRWLLHSARTPSARRPRVRFYSIRRFHSDAFDIEVAVHEDADGPPAPGSTWALTAKPGDRVAFYDEGRSYGVTPGAEWQLLVGDESALPPILAILDRSADALPTVVFLEVPTREDIREDLVVPASTRIHWLSRDDTSIRPGTLALQAVRDAELASGPFYTWTAGESALPTGLRRHLVNDRGVPKSDIAFSGYWRHGRASQG